MTWWCTGIRWQDGSPAVGWYATGRGERTSPLVYGRPLAFAARGGRHCLGVRRAGKRTPCPTGAEVPGRAGNAQCAECARLDRSFSGAADTNAADPRPYRVYLAWFGPGLVKVGSALQQQRRNVVVAPLPLRRGYVDLPNEVVRPPGKGAVLAFPTGGLSSRSLCHEHLHSGNGQAESTSPTVPA